VRLGVLAPTLEAHHALYDGLACFGNVGLFARAIGTVFTHLLGLAAYFDGQQFIHFVVAGFAGGHEERV
jgi:hypothetical protein